MAENVEFTRYKDWVVWSTLLWQNAPQGPAFTTTEGPAPESQAPIIVQASSAKQPSRKKKRSHKPEEAKCVQTAVDEKRRITCLATDPRPVRD